MQSGNPFTSKSTQQKPEEEGLIFKKQNNMKKLHDYKRIDDSLISRLKYNNIGNQSVPGNIN